MKKMLRKKMWIIAAIVLAVGLLGMYLPIVSNHDQILTGLVYECDESGNILSKNPVDSITVEVDANRQSFALNGEQTLKGIVKFSQYMKKGEAGKVNVVNDVNFELESRYARCVSDYSLIPSEIVYYRAAEKDLDQYLSCSDIFYEDDSAYSGIRVFPGEVPIQREMKYSEDFDKMIWTDYHNQFVYICAKGEVNTEAMLGYFAQIKAQ